MPTRFCYAHAPCHDTFAQASGPLVALRRLPLSGASRVLAKLEYADPTGSMKDRLALAAINAAEAGGRLHRVATAHATQGATHGLWKHDRTIHVMAVEAEESPVLSGRTSGSHGINGVGVGFIPPLWEPDQVNELMTVSTTEAKTMARRLAREEGIVAGTSSGASVLAAFRLAQRLGPEATVATIIVDSGLRCLSTDVFRRAPSRSCRDSMEPRAPLLQPRARTHPFTTGRLPCEL